MLTALRISWRHAAAGYFAAVPGAGWTGRKRFMAAASPKACEPPPTSRSHHSYRERSLLCFHGSTLPYKAKLHLLAHPLKPVIDQHERVGQTNCTDEL